MRQSELFDGGAARQLALEVDGVALTVGVGPDAAYRAAFETLSEVERGALTRLSQAGPIRAGGGLFDDLAALLRLLGCSVSEPKAGDELFDGAWMVAIGCPHRSFDLSTDTVERFLAGGGLLLTSDKAARLPALAALLPTRKPQGPRRARLALGNVADSLLPAVALDAGHAPLDAEWLDPAAQVLARDVLTDMPLAVLLPVGTGAVLHAVPHWRQMSDPGCTALEARPLHSVAAYRGLVPAAPSGLTLGAFWAAEAMLRTLACGLLMRFGMDPEVPETSSQARLER